ncbi:DUF7739 domain-containing protein [Streptomyces acidicola]|uniref:DUF7739 domain-containing protein n=1 Tax=Streptomyces acidicola TaxID=2596892 RepID=A0A5N8WJX1_9ACTN|nr:hypothetical protein [Streptomyces acidicola]MPY47136.1 hypothetical protein [Streptomyces acidicola]MPY47275.1 hypothetical protein [Streptomyces acidicola]
MGISISHGAGGSRSGLTISNLGQHLAHTLTASEWREISDLFDGTFADVASIPPHEADRIGELLHKAAGHRLMPTNWGDLATHIGDSANRAARAGQNWEWT